MPSARQCSFACPYNLSPGKISPRRTVSLTKLVQGKQSIADHVCSRMFVDLNTDALHLKTDGRGRSRDTIRYPLPFFPERYLDNFLLLSGSVRRFRYLTGFFTQSPDMVVKCADGDPVLYTPLTVGKPLDLHCVIRSSQKLSFKVVLICFQLLQSKILE